MNRFHVLLLVGLVMGPPCGSCSAQTDATWPFFRHDAQLTGRSPAVGDMTHAPVELWKYYLGGWKREFVVTYAGGRSSQFALPGSAAERVAPAGAAGNWHSPPLVDLAGNGELAPPPPGKIAKLLPDVAGLQQVVWEHPPDKPTCGIGRCYSFEQGPDRPRLVWETEEESEVYELLWTIADLDGDGLLDVVFMTHYRILVFDGQTGEKKSTLQWPIGRNYGQMTLADVDGDRLPEVVVVVDSPPHVDVLKYAPHKGEVLWSHRYITDAQVSLPIDVRLRVFPNHVQDIDGDGRLEIVYNLFDSAVHSQWHVIVRDALTGNVKYELPGIHLWGLIDLDATGTDSPEDRGSTPASPTRPALCCLEATGRGIPEMGRGRLLQFDAGNWATLWEAEKVRWQMRPYDWPLTEFSIASLGPSAHAVPYGADVDGDARPEVFVTHNHRTIEAIGRRGDSEAAVKWSMTGPQDAVLTVEATRPNRADVLINVDAAEGDVTTRDCQVEQLGHGSLSSFAPLPSRTLPIMADMDGDGTNEVVVQDSQWRTRVLRFSPGQGEPRELLRVSGAGLWLGRRWAGFPYSKFPVFTFDFTGDGKRELLLTDVADEVVSTVTCLDMEGQSLWKRALPSTPAQSIVWMAAGRFMESHRFDLLAVVQNDSIGECFCLAGDSGEILWRMGELQLADGTPFNFGSHAPYLAVADLDGDGLDDLCGQSGQYVAVVGGKDGQPLVTPRNMIHDLFPRWVNYGVNVVGDWDRSGRVSMFTNTTTNGFGLIDPDLKVKWFADRDGLPLVRVGSIGREDDGEWMFGTFSGTTFKTFEMKSGTETVSEDMDGGFSTITTEVVCADVDGDRLDDFLAAANDVLICVRGDRGAGPRLKWKVQLPTAASELLFADADNDGRPDILYTGTDGSMHCLGSAR